MALNKQVWTNQIMENYYPDTSFLKYAKDMTAFVDNNKINLADAGIDPEVTKNNTNYPIAITQRDDAALSLDLARYTTDNTIVRDAVITELSYEKMESVLKSHKGALLTRTGADAAFAYSPDGNTTNTPILKTTGQSRGDGFKRLIPEDIVTLMEKWNALNYPLDDRYLTLDSRHLADLINWDLKFFGNITDIVNGKLQKFAGFNILAYSENAKYNINTLQKRPFGAEADANTTFSSFAFVGNEVMKADGDVEMFERLKDPEYRGDIVGFEKRFLALPIRNKGISAIVSDKV